MPRIIDPSLQLNRLIWRNSYWVYLEEIGVNRFRKASGILSATLSVYSRSIRLFCG